MVRRMARVLLCCALLSLGHFGCGHGSSKHPHPHGDGGHPSSTHGAAAEPFEATDHAASAIAPAFTELGPGVQVIDDASVAARSDSSTFTHEGHFAPLLFGEDLRAFSIRLEPGMFLAEHPHPSGSMVYTVQGRWVLCSGGNRRVMDAGSVFHFAPNAPTGWEAPFPEGAELLIVKTLEAGQDYATYRDDMAQLAAKLDDEHRNGGVFYFHQLEPEHPAVVFARAQGASVDQLLRPAPK